ncbi:MAG TPA: sensor histidine kinase [Bryobacteraceae bacterium]|nr:sensor histidine kinase [Bryobacteraceae bacterium]
MLRSLRSRLLLASFLWTAGLLLLMHMLVLMLTHVTPRILNFRGMLPVQVAVALMVAGVFGVRATLARFRRLREGLMAVRTGRDHRVAGQFPTEVQPLVDDLNALLEDREKAVNRALSTAGDLAHGLKTPLALLAQEADRAEAGGNHELAASIAQQVERMSRQVDYHLARARAAASGSTAPVRCPVAPCVDALVRTLSKLYVGRALDISAGVPPDLAARVEREDLDEMLGNLLDNACKWAHSKILVAVALDAGMLLLTVDDDGPGLSAKQCSMVLVRGVRLDEAAPGSGLGLAIVRDLAELYGGSIALHPSPLGGLRARLLLPAS